ncbi:MAG: hypothetical protein OEV85_12405 [Candidatus Thorarchaeota archaeon]|nr:hypothetical protein [Candidatus Thorarchaeota archaeon]
MSSSEKEKSEYLPDLIANESVLWNQKASVNLKPLLRNGCIPIILLLITPIVLDSIVHATPASLIIIIALYDVVAPPALILIFLYMIYFVVQSKKTTYYLTSERLLETRNAKILEEIPRENLQGFETDQFMKSEWHHQNLGVEYYEITITDQKSGKFMILTGIDKKSVSLVEKWAKGNRL